MTVSDLSRSHEAHGKGDDMNKSHTPGPWKAVSEEVTKEIEVFEVAEISHFRVIYAGRGDGFDVAGDAYCDARLIAAAPEMLAALLDLLAVTEAIAAERERTRTKEP